MTKNNFFTCFLPILTAAVFIPLVSCQIGLGAAVDTEAPTLEITYPPASAVIRGTFTLAGSCDDDKGISSISVTVANTDDKSKAWSYSTSAAAGGKSWTISLNQQADDTATGFRFPDGKYEITVAAKDDAGHTSGTSSRAFEIDNTAPVFIVKTPAAILQSKASKYGSVFSIDGTIADDHTVKTMASAVYSESKTLLTSEPYTESDVETAGGTSVSIAKYVAGGTDELNTRYTDIYGDNTKAGTQYYYCTVTLTDSAKSYINPAETSNATAGNTTSSCWLYDDVYTTLLSTKNDGYGLEASDLKNILNGNLTGTITRTKTVDTSEVLTQLNSLVKNTTADETPLAFSLNPDASPRYVVNGYALPDDISNVENGTRGQTITVVATAGLDGTLIVPSTIKVWLHEYDDISDSSAYSEFLNNPGTDTGGKLLKDNSGDTSSSAATCTLSVQLPSDKTILTDTYYIVAVTGTDADGSALTTDSVYGFIGAVTGTPPTLSVDTPAELSTKGSSDDLTYSLTAKSTTSTVKSVSCTVTVTDETNSHTVGTITGEAVQGSGNTWTFSPKNCSGTGYEACKALKDSKLRYLYTASFKASDENGNSTTAGRSVHIDTLAPVVKITSVTPIVNDSGTQYVNGTITIAGTVNEADLKDVTYAVYTAGSSTPAATGSLGVVYSFSREIDTTAFTDDADIQIVVSATDNSDNTGSADTTSYNSGTPLAVKQSTDAPKLTVNNADTDITSAADIKNATLSNASLTNIFGTTSNNKISCTITDDDGIRTVTGQYRTHGTANYGSSTTLISGGTSTTGVVNYTLPGTEGLYDILLTVTDTTGTTGCHVTTQSLVTAVDEGAPVITVTTPADGSYCATSFTVSGTVNDSSAVMLTPAYYVYDSGTGTYGTTTKISAGTPVNSNKSWTTTVASTESSQYRIVFSAQDIYGQTSTYTFNYKVDNIPPAFTITKLGSAALGTAISDNAAFYQEFAKKSTLYTIGGTVTDGGSSGISDFVYYKLAASEPGKTADSLSYDVSADGWSKATIVKSTSSNTWTANLDFSDSMFAEGTAYTVYLATTDNAGNTSRISANPSSCVSVTPDATAPTAGSVTADPAAITSANSTSNVTITAAGIADNTNGSGIASVQLYENGSAIGTMTGSSGTYTCTLANTGITTGTHTYTVRATDNVGNTSAENYSVTLHVDKTPPNITINGVSPTTTAGKMNGLITVTGNANDETELASCTWAVYDGSTRLTTGGTSGTLGASSETEKVYKSFSFTVDTRNITAGSGTYTLKMNAVDAAGNTSATATYTLPIDQSTDKPVITLDAPANAGITTESGITASSGLFKSTENLTGTLTDDDGIKSITILIDSTTTTPDFSVGTKSYSLTKSLTDLSEGAHSVLITVKDTEFETTTTAGTFYIGIDNNPPELVVATESGKYYKDAFTIEGKAKDSYAMADANPVTYDGSAVSSYVSSTDTSGDYAGYHSWSQSVGKPAASTSATKTVTAKDKFGRTNSKTFTYTFDLDAPVIAISAIDDNGNGNTISESGIPTTYFNKNNKLVVTGSAGDTDGSAQYQSGLAGIQWTIVSGSGASKPEDGSGEWTPLTASASWTINADLSEKSDGAYTLWIKTADGAGNETSVSRNIYAISSAPSLTETTIAAGTAYKNGTFSAGGTIDTANMLSLTCKVNGVSTAVKADSDNDWSAGDSGWHVTNTSPAEGSYAYVVTATNKAKMSTSLTRTVVVDTTPPAVTITSPANGTFFASESQTIKGTASDATAGLKTLEISYDGGLSYSEITVSGSWLTGSDFNDGTYQVSARATDNAGNTQTASSIMTIDTTAPTTSLTVSSGSLYDTASGTAGGAVTSPSFGSSYLAGTGFTLGGTITEVNFDTASLSVSKNGGTAAAVTFESGNWSYSQSADTSSHANDGTYSYALTIKDKAGNLFSKSVSVTVDTTAPSLDVTSPAAGEAVSSSAKTIKGTASDNGAGTASVYYELRKAGTTTVVTSDGTPITDNAALTGESWSVSGMPLGSSEGTLDLYVKATDKLSHTTEKIISFCYDKANPVLTETGIDVSGKTTNAVFTLSGTAGDTNALAASNPLTVTDTVNGTLVGTYYPAATDDGAGTYTWTQSLTPTGTSGSVADGTHVYTITVTDIAGKTTSLTRTVTADTTLPAWNTSNSDDTDNKAPYISTAKTNDYYKTTSLSVKALAADTLSGVSKLQYNLNNTGYVDTGNGNFTIAAAEGINTILVRAVDAAGNVTVPAEFTAKIDTTAPDTCTLAQVDGSSGVSTKLTNGKSNITFTFAATDSSGTNPSGIASAAVSKIGSKAVSVTATEVSGEYSVTIPAADLTVSGTVTVTLTDKAGNTASFPMFAIQLDTVDPVITISSPAAAAIVNKVINITGTASDNLSLAGTAVLFIETAKDTFTQSGSAVSIMNGSWTFSIDTADTTNIMKYDADSSASGTQLCFKVTAEDSAGNAGSSSRTITVDQDTDRPVINLTNLSLGGMSASQVIWLKNANVVYGTVTDDDGIENGSASLYYNTDGGATWTAVAVTNGSWNLTLDDGEKTLYFKVIDKAATSFISAASGTTSPKLSDGTNTFAGYTILHLNVDKTPPAYGSIKYKVYDTETGTWSSDWLADYANEKFGGIHNKFRLQLTATDNNGIASIATTFNGATDTQSSAASGNTWETGAIDASSGNGSLKVKLVITDGAGLTSEPEFNISVDNAVPSVTIVTPSAQISSAETIHGSVSETSTVYYAVSRTDTTAPGTTAVANQSTAWGQITDATLSWNVYFDGNTSATQTHTDLFRYYISTLGIASEDDITNNVYKDLTTLYVWIKAVDESGNFATKSQPVLIDPQGDRPVVTLSYPESDGETLGGAVRMIGTATDNVAAKYVWVQIDTDGDGDFDSTDQSTLATDGYTLGDMTQNSSTPNSDASKNGIMVTVSGSSWNLTINSNGEFNPTGSETTKRLILRIYATDADKNVSSVITRTVYIDKDTPVIVQDSLKLVQYETSSGSGVACTDGSVSSGTVAASQSYTDSMSIRGIWFLTGSITDDSGIKKITKNSVDVITAAGQQTAEFIKGTKSSTTEAYDYIMNIPVGSATADAVGTTSITITATENTANNLNVTKTFSVIYDNKAPEITTSGDDFNISSTIVNSNGFYTFGSVAAENSVSGTNQTGVERIAFYFTRDIDSLSTHNLYDVLIANGSGGNTISSYSSLVSSDGLWWKSASVSSVSGATISLSASDDNIHAGGLAKVNGVIYRISSVVGTDVTLSGEPGSTANALFAVAGVVDNTTAEGTGTAKNDAGYYTNGAYDDGDLMMESVIKQGTSYTWEANINSKNIPDGKIVLHYVVFDKAGNYAVGTVDAFVKNNQPRIAGMKIGTDDNGDSTVDSSEYITTMSNVYAKGLNSAGNKVTDVTFPNQESGLTSAVTAKGLTVIKPEIVGGNGTLGYTYTVAENSGATTWNTPYYTKTSVTELGTGGESSDSVVTLTNDITFTVQDFLSAGTTGSEIADGSNQKFSFTIWDSTPGTTIGTDSQYATMNVVMNVTLRDTTPATDYIKPFYWNSSSDNSLFANSRDNGHIELPADLPTDTFKSTNSGEYDLQPKVSGQIKIEGIAHDNTLLSSLTATVAGFNSGSSFTIAAYNTGTGSWTSGSSLSGGAIPAEGWACETAQATYAEYVKAGYGSLPSGYTGTEKVPYTSQATGHTVHWILYFDTSKITGTADTDKLISVTAQDRGKPTLSGGTVSYIANTFSAETGQTGGSDGSGSYTSQYTVDVVPYITGIKTSLSSLKSNNPSVYSRTALGHYPVNSTLKAYVFGYNITDAAPVYIENADSGTNASLDTTTYSGSTCYSVTASSLDSGKLSLQINGVSTLNNVNNNNAAGDYSGTYTDSTYAYCYNRQPNGDNNNLLSDDVVLDVWQFNSKAAVPISGLISEPVMKISPKSGMIGFAFTNGPLYFSMPGTVSANARGTMAAGEYSYVYWQGSYDFMTSVGLTYDSDGHTYGCAAGGDINSTQADRFSFMTDRWGVSGEATGGSYDGANANRLEVIAQYGDSSGNNTSTLNFDKNRIKSPEYATARHGTSTNIYLAYFDDLNEEIRFKYGNLTDSKTSKDNFGNFNDAYRNGTVDNTANLNRGKYSTNYVNVIAGSTTGRNAGEYLSMGVISAEESSVDDVVVLIWYDSYNNALLYTYNTNPTAGTTGANVANWQGPYTIFEGAGEYCRLAVDAGGGIHIAAYDGTNGDLMYAYLPQYNQPGNKETCTVDSYAIVGQNITIDVGKSGSAYVPYIGYYALSSAKPKLAYRVSSTVENGVSGDAYTGNWEATLIPTTSKATQETINVGLWKSADGVIKNSTTGASSTSTNWGKCYGNGTANPVLGYAIKESSTKGDIETAQMK